MCKLESLGNANDISSEYCENDPSIEQEHFGQVDNALDLKIKDMSFNPREPQGYLKYISFNLLSTVNWFICIFH